MAARHGVERACVVPPERCSPTRKGRRPTYPSTLIALGLGLAGVSEKLTAAQVIAALRKPMFDAVDGAILLVGGAVPKGAER
jgi:hypothetical protein